MVITAAVTEHSVECHSAEYYDSELGSTCSPWPSSIADGCHLCVPQSMMQIEAVADRNDDQRYVSELLEYSADCDSLLHFNWVAGIIFILLGLAPMLWWHTLMKKMRVSFKHGRRRGRVRNSGLQVSAM
eukprot:SAG31_NODE_24911_length_472_cov_0.825737_1_plen_128_part_10